MKDAYRKSKPFRTVRRQAALASTPWSAAAWRRFGRRLLDSSPRARELNAGQSGVKSPHSKELTDLRPAFYGFGAGLYFATTASRQMLRTFLRASPTSLLVATTMPTPSTGKSMKFVCFAYYDFWPDGRNSSGPGVDVW